jgi:hypothetical protein
LSFTEIKTIGALKQFQQNNYVQLYKRISRKLGTGFKYKNMEVAESAADLLIYKELVDAIQNMIEDIAVNLI